ncbi:hypothetical protein AAEU29_16830 [Pseudoalteromonas sp. SSM20]|uniref:hypothetical protein n=1 Tax=Pseudoalteromonas sp. SSM20 TaxID=3139394 RepID=UPI003BAC28EB
MQFAAEYLLACLMMGAAIGMDVALVTALYSNKLTCAKTRFKWVSGVVGSHTLLPMCGYLLSFYGIKWLPWLTPLLGIVALGFIAVYLYDELFSSDDSNPLLATISWSLIIAVSWDALWSGPAKSAQVVEWQSIFVWTSFIVVGAVVYLFTLAGLKVGDRLASNEQHTPFVWLWLQYSAIGYFGLLALMRYTFSLNTPDWQIFLLSVLIVRGLLVKERPIFSNSITN